MACARHANVFQHLIIDMGEQISVNVVGFEGVGILGETDLLEPIPYCAHAASSSRSAFASFRSTVSKPSVNHIDGCEQIARLALPALLAPQPGEARGGAQFVAACALLAGDREGGAERLLGLRQIGIWQPSSELAAQAMNFCVPAPRAGDG